MSWRGSFERTRPDAIVVNLPTVERGQAVVDAAGTLQPAATGVGFPASEPAAHRHWGQAGMSAETLSVPRAI